MIPSDNFRQALQDYIFLLNKKYPEKSIHEMVSTRYALNHFERSMLYRGITLKDRAESRKLRLVPAEKLPGLSIHLDLFNILFTIAAYLRGFPVYLSNDGLLRDASEGHDSNEWVAHLEKSLVLLLDHINALNVTEVTFYLDNPLHLSSYVAREIEKAAGSLAPETCIVRDESPDHLLRDASEGILATSDSTIIDRSSLPVFDLPRHILKTAFDPRFPDILQLAATPAP